jgi:hypothetical protein
MEICYCVYANIKWVSTLVLKDVIRSDWVFYTRHIRLLVSGFNAHTCTTLVRILAGECTNLERLMCSCIMRNFKGWLVKYFLLLDA